ncbi:hypothetical protein Franean1_4215 [Parafrankia sp. EAN1pec]|nr:hypothetical protein Franean1_4215 [Frankia sp. EAN1pec]
MAGEPTVLVLEGTLRRVALAVARLQSGSGVCRSVMLSDCPVPWFRFADHTLKSSPRPREGITHRQPSIFSFHFHATFERRRKVRQCVAGHDYWPRLLHVAPPFF